MADSKDKKTTVSKAKTTSGSKTKASVAKTDQAVTKSALTASSLPTAAALKDRFKAGSIPLQTDFADLIDMAETGRRAVGGAPDQSGPGAGFKLDDKGTLQLKLNADYTEKDYSPVKIHDDILTVDLGSGLINKTNGICIVGGTGIVVNNDSIAIDPQTVLPKGIITMFSGTKAPEGWALCDGDNGTPDLVDRFILGGDFSQSGKKGGASLQGGGDEKTCKIFTDQQGPGVIDVTVKGTALKADQLPPHSHNVRHTWNTGSGAGGTTSITVGNEKNPARREMIDAYGDPAKEHTHSASATVGTHAHSFTSLPAYYILAFIMKL